jgi:altronate hydrolase
MNNNTLHRWLQIHPADNVLVALTGLPAGSVVQHGDKNFALPQDVPAKHKFTLEPLPPGAPVRMYGVLVGTATRPVAQGGWVNLDNTRHAASGATVNGNAAPTWTPPDVSRWRNRTFRGFHRLDGGIGTANHWLVVPLVFCENRNIESLKEALLPALGYESVSPWRAMFAQMTGQYKNGTSIESILEKEWSPSTHQGVQERLFPNVDGIKFLTHEGGCGCNRQDSDALCGLLAGYITHPNVAGATVLSLGCQHAQVQILTDEIHKRCPKFSRPLYVFEQQKYGSTENLLSNALKHTLAGLAEANRCAREPAPLSELCIGLECGGSDGFSGISANPAVGHVSDLLTALGGSVILSEFPELCGVEQELCDRTADRETAHRFLELMQTYNSRAVSAGSGFDMNPSPGNIRDGLITDAIKSAGAAKKGGNSPVTAVLDYPERITRKGLNLLCTPGNDVESTTAEVASGANIVLFTTGLGTPTGNPIAPVVKISTNTDLFRRMPDIIDLDAGTIIEGLETIEQAGERFLEYVIQAASGDIVPKAVQLGQNDFIPWKRGVSL